LIGQLIFVDNTKMLQGREGWANTLGQNSVRGRFDNNSPVMIG